MYHLESHPQAQPIPGARLHVVGVMLLALFLQALSPLLHARLLSWHAALTGLNVDMATLCVPGRVPPPPTDDGEGTPSPLIDGAACGCGTIAVANLAVAGKIRPPPPSILTSAPPTAPGTIRSAAIATGHHPRGPPGV